MTNKYERKMLQAVGSLQAYHEELFLPEMFDYIRILWAKSYFGVALSFLHQVAS